MFVFILIPTIMKYNCINGWFIYSCIYEISSAIYLFFVLFLLRVGG